MEALRTPDDRFADLPGYPFAPHYAELADGEGGNLRVHYLDEGPGDGPIVLLMHGEPSWSYLYRKMIPTLVAAGYRCIAPDLIGFGRSDKPVDRAAYTYERHVAWMRELLFDRLGLDNITLYCQDWGGLIGLRLVAERPAAFDRVCVANTFLPTGDSGASEAFLAWQKFAREVEEFPTGGILNGATVSDLAAEVIAAYDAPFPDERYKAAARMFPLRVPIPPANPAIAANRAAWEELAKFERPFLTAFSDSDPVSAGADAVFREKIPGTKGQPHTTIVGAGHFLQEDKGEEIAAMLLDWMRR